jgi:DNA segregation ATPase FtsK/SpoIIIE-like protein
MGKLEETKSSSDSGLVIPLGANIDGASKILDLAQAPSILIAGSVMSGKRAFINGIIASLITRTDPGKVRLILDDVTRVELPTFNGVPHLLKPVIIRLEETVSTLQWLLAEAEIRRKKIVKTGATDSHINNTKEDPMPAIVLVIYEIADLMYTKQCDA